MEETYRRFEVSGKAIFDENNAINKDGIFDFKSSLDGLHTNMKCKFYVLELGGNVISYTLFALYKANSNKAN